MANTVTFPQPPRFSGRPSDLAAVVQWLWDFYRAAIPEQGFVQPSGLAELLQTDFPVLYNLGTISPLGADQLAYFTNDQGAQALTSLTSFSRSVLAGANQSAWQSTLGIAGVVTDAELLALAALVSASDRLPYFTGLGTAALAVFTAAGRSLVDDATVADMRTTLGLGAIATETYATGTWTPAFTNLTEVLGGGTVDKAGSYTRLGRLVKWRVTISTTGGATHASTAGSTFHDLPIAAAGDDTLVAANRTTNIGIGTGALDAANDRAYPPTWAATSDTIVISGAFEA